jgi:primosomal protein N' (replication factor Y) (superfamily II helicase)
MSYYYQIAVDFPVNDSVLTYGADIQLERGDMVVIPLGRRKSQGIVLEESSAEKISSLDTKKIKFVIELMQNSFRLSQDELALYEWMAKYYHYSLGKLIFDCLPKIMKRPKKISFSIGQTEDIPYTLSPKQSEIYQAISAKMHLGFSQHYLHGVTGSGKSIVFLKLIYDVLKTGKSAQFLLPEINLTPQFINMFKRFLPFKVYSYHSGVTASEKYLIWQELKESSEPVLVMGVRSSIFLPINNLGLIIVDEEHDQSFKQNDRCPYNGRDVAIKKAQLNQSTIVLGSATPSLENYYQFSEKIGQRYYYTLEERVTGHFPKLHLLDTRNKFDENNPAWPLLDDTIEIIQEHLERDEQVLVFINKLGYSNYVQCRGCGHQFINENCGCQNNLRYFKAKNLLKCSHCDFKMPMPDKCPACGSLTLMNKGFGTEKVQDVLSSLFPQKAIERFDRDEITNLIELNQKLDRFHNKEIDILVGTQMLAKGHNFERVNLVVILGIDSMLNYSDFRSTERTFQLAQQVAGRSGRFSSESKVIIQTMNPEHNLFRYIEEHSFHGFYQDEMSLRKICFCPPFSRIAMIYFSSRFRDKVIEASNQVTRHIYQIGQHNFSEVKVLGPTPMSVEKKANQFTWAIMLKSDNVNQLHNLLTTFEENYRPLPSVTYKIDIDPTTVL